MGLCKVFLALYSCLLFALALVVPSHAEDLPQDYVDAHNAARTKVDVEPVIWDENVVAYAQNYANQRTDCNLVHSNGPYGEKIAWSGAADYSTADTINMWVSENVDYDYNSNTCGAGEMLCLHYTQVVWRNTVRIGCGKVRCSNGGIFITCNYDPPATSLARNLTDKTFHLNIEMLKH